MGSLVVAVNSHKYPTQPCTHKISYSTTARHDSVKGRHLQAVLLIVQGPDRITSGFSGCVDPFQEAHVTLVLHFRPFANPRCVSLAAGTFMLIHQNAPTWSQCLHTRCQET